MERTKKILALGLSATLLLQSASAFADTMDSDVGTMASGLTSGLTDTVSSDSGTDESASSDNGDVTVSDSDVRKGDYTVNGDLTVTGNLYVFGNLDVNGSLVIDKNAKLRVTGMLSVNGDVENNGGSVYAKKRDFNGSTSGSSRKFDSEIAQIDPLLAASVTGEEREELIAEIIDSKKEIRSAARDQFFDTLEAKIQEEDAAAFEKLRKTLLNAFKRKLVSMGGMKDAMLDAFEKKFASMETSKLEALVTKVEKLQKATKKKRFAFQLAQLKDLVEQELESRTASEDSATVEVPTATTDSSATTATTSSSGTTSDASTASGTTATTSSSGTTATTDSASTSTSSGSTTTSGSGTSTTTGQ